MAAIDTNSDGKISLEELTSAIRTQRYYGIQDGRYSVILSLQEVFQHLSGPIVVPFQRTLY